MDVSSGSCHGAMQETVDDLVIFVEVSPIDGPGGTLGQAGPCYIRGGSDLPITGQMTLDEDDLDDADGLGILDDLILHEMGHVLGFGTLWEIRSLLTGGGTNDPYFTGAQAISAFNDIGGASYSGNAVPVENTGGSGTRDGHWRDSEFDSELMTGWLTVGSNPLSSVSIASFGDVGYAVDLSAADGFSLSLSLMVGPQRIVRLGAELLHAPEFRVDPAGRVMKVAR
jgi:hypothetical protein